MANKKITITRGDLYKRVWETPIIKLAKEFGLSDNGLAKICKKLNIPKPKVGYWSKIAAGYKIKPIPLPEINDDTPLDYTINTENKNLILAKLVGPDFNESELKDIRIPQRISRYHPLVKLTMAPEERGRYHKRLDIRVPEKSLKRAYRIFDTLIKELEKLGAKVSLTDGDRNSYTSVIIDEINLPVKLVEKDKQLPNPEYREDRFVHKYIYEPSGTMELVIDKYFSPYQVARKSVRDTSSKKIEDRIGEFILILFNAAAVEKRNQEHYEEQWRKQEQERLERERKIELYNNEKKKVELLFENVDKHTKAKFTREYIDKVTEDFRQKNGQLTDEFKAWVKWANDQADRLDPLKESPPSILDEEIKKNYW